MPIDRGQLIDAVKEMSGGQEQAPEKTGDIQLDLSQFPELQDKKEGDTATITVKLVSVSGKMASVVPASAPDEKQPAEPSKEGYRENPVEGGL